MLEIFDDVMEFPNEENDSLAKMWLEEHKNSFTSFVSNDFLPINSNKYEVCNHFTGEKYADVFLAEERDFSLALVSSQKGLNVWEKSSQKSEMLLKIAESIEKNKHLFALVESLSSGRHLNRTENRDVPLLIESLKFYSDVAFATNTEGLTNLGVIRVFPDKLSSIPLHINWKVGSILSSGNVICLLVDKTSCLSALLFAELCQKSGLPDGVVNVLPVDFNTLCSLPIPLTGADPLSASKIIFSGSVAESCGLIERSAQGNIPCEVLRPQPPLAVVYESADLHSAVDGVLEAYALQSTRNEDGCFKILLQESIQKRFEALLENKLSRVTVGHNLLCTDMSCLVTASQKLVIEKAIAEAKEQQFKVLESARDFKDILYPHVKPTVICNVPTTSSLLEKLSGPVMVTTPFRTAKESLAMLNWDNSCQDVSIWTEKLTLAHEIAAKLQRGRTVWLNTQAVYSPHVVSGGGGEGGNSVEGGLRAFWSHLQFTEQYDIATSSFSVEFADAALHNPQAIGHYIGGCFQSRGSRLRTVQYSSECEMTVYEGSPSDINTAVAAAFSSQKKWESLGLNKRCQILIKAAKLLMKSKSDLSKHLQDITGQNAKHCDEDLETSIENLRIWSNSAQINMATESNATPMPGRLITENCAIGVIGVLLDNDDRAKPLLSFLSVAVPAIACGNSVVFVAGSNYPTAALKGCELLNSAGLPKGVLNVICGTSVNLMKELSFHADVDAIWYDSWLKKSEVYESCANRMKRVFYCHGVSGDATPNEVKKLTLEATEAKSIYIPMGTIFAN